MWCLPASFQELGHNTLDIRERQLGAELARHNACVYNIDLVLGGLNVERQQDAKNVLLA